MHNDSTHDLMGTGQATSCHYCPVNQWSNEQVLEWLRAVCHDNNIDSGNLVGFAECTGLQLCSMAQNHFLEIHPLHGNLFFRKFREYLEHRQRQERYRYPFHPHHHHHHHHQCSPTTPSPIQYITQNPTTSNTYYDLLPRPHPAPPHPTSYWQDIPYHPNTYPGDSPCYPAEGTLPHGSGDFGGAVHPGYQPGYPLPYDYSGDSTPSPPSVPPPVTSQGYLPGPLPNVGSPSSPPPPMSPLSGQQDTRRDRGPKLWEFLLDLLEDPAYNPTIIRWENQEDRTFRLTSPHEVSLKWGQRRPNQNSLPYDYFARALRYHYKTGMLVSVPERKLVYKFGSLVFQQRRRGPNTPLLYHNPDSPHTDASSSHPP